MGASLERALVLFDQSNYDLAEQELRKELSTDPNQPVAHALLGLCLVRKKKWEEATQAVKQAVHLGPAIPFVHYAMADVFHQRNAYKEARVAAEEALRLDPDRADYYAKLAAIYIDQNRWQEGLSHAEHGLKVDPEHVGLANMKAIALVKLGRLKEAGGTVQIALAKDPENALTHANMGWSLLEKSRHTEALSHFKEALRIDPELEWARDGIVEALKSKNFIYGLMLRYFLWMAKLSGSARWGFSLGLYFAAAFLRGVARQSPDLIPWVTPLLIFYTLFVILSWTADPLFNLLLRLNRFGRLALSQDQILASNLVGLCLLIAILIAGLAVIAKAWGALFLALIFGFLVFPLSGAFRCSPGWPRNIVIGLALFCAVFGTLGTGFFLAANSKGPFNGFLTLSTVVLILSPWIANALVGVVPKKR